MEGCYLKYKTYSTINCRRTQGCILAVCISQYNAFIVVIIRSVACMHAWSLVILLYAPSKLGSVLGVGRAACPSGEASDHIAAHNCQSSRTITPHVYSRWCVGMMIVQFSTNQFRGLKISAYDRRPMWDAIYSRSHPRHSQTAILHMSQNAFPKCPQTQQERKKLSSTAGFVRAAACLHNPTPWELRWMRSAHFSATA